MEIMALQHGFGRLCSHHGVSGAAPRVWPVGLKAFCVGCVAVGQPG